MNKQFFIISFLPAIAYWYLEENYSLKIALIGGGALALLEIIIEKVLTKHVHSISKFNFFLILGLGTIAYIGDEGIWFKLQPFFTGLFMGGFLLYKSVRGQSMMLEMMETLNNNNIPNKLFIKIVERDMAIFLILYGGFMAWVAVNLSTSQWTFYKTIGFYVCSFIFFVFEFIRLRNILNKK